MPKKPRLGTDPPGTVLLFLLPSMAGFIIFLVLPMLSSAVLSFTNYSGGYTLDFVGLKNYLQAFSSSIFLNSLKVTVVFVLGAVALQLALGLLFALVLDGGLPGQRFFRSLFFMPVVLSSVAISLAFMLLLHPSKGPVNGLLQGMGLEPLGWLSDKATALPTILMVFVWQNFGYYMVIFISGLQSIPPSLYEAADMDGCGRLRKFWCITFPMLTPVTFFSLIMAVIKSFQVYEQVYIMTGGPDGGGPARSTSVLVFEIYRSGFTHFQFGYASAQAFILMVIVLAVTVIQYRGQQRWVNYEIV